MDTVIRIDGHVETLVPLGYGAPSSAVAVSRDGIIALAQPQESAVRLFGADGEFLARVGGRGAGPGEMMRVNRIGWKADSLWVVDHGLARVTLFAPDRTPIRTIPIPTSVVARLSPDGESHTFPNVRVLEILQDDTLFARLNLNAGHDGPEEFQARSTFAPITIEGTLERIIVSVPLGNIQMNTPQGESFTLPFPNRVYSEVSVGGSVTAFAEASIDGGAAGTFSVTAVGLAGDTLFERQHPFSPVEIPDAVRDSVSGRRDVPIPAIYPPLAGMVVGSDSSIWVELIEAPEGRPYIIFTADGDLVRSTYLPRDMTIAEVHKDRVWVVQTDEFGVESVLELALRPEDAPPPRGN